MAQEHLRTVVLFGAGSSVLVDVEETCIRHGMEIVAIVNNFDCNSYAIHTEKVIHLTDVTPEMFKHSLVIPLFTPAHRKYARDQAGSMGARRFDPLVDQTAIIPTSMKISEGVYVNSGVTFGGVSFLGAFAFVNRGVSLGHHLTLGEFASVGPGVVTGGHVSIGRGAVIGTGAVILPGISIGANAVVGGGSVVTHDVPDNTLVIGNPARITKQGIEGYNGVGI